LIELQSALMQTMHAQHRVLSVFVGK